MAANHPPRDQVIADFKADMASSNSVDDVVAVFGSPAAATQKPYPPCKTALDGLKPMLIYQMKSHKHHRGRMVTVRVCTEPAHRLSAVVAVVEDVNGTAAPLFLYNMHVRAVARADSILPKGIVCIIKEPFLKPKKKKDTYSIKVDHLTDIVFLHETDDRVPDSWKKSKPAAPSAEIRLQGNTHVKAQNWLSALQSYSQAIELSSNNEERQSALVNRALVNLRLGRYNAVLTDCSQAADPSTPNLRLLYRTAMAYYGLEDFSKCRDTLLQLIDISPEEPSGKSALARAEARLHEQATGQYAFSSMYEQAAKSSGLVDCASFYGPIEVRESPGRGRGLFLAKAVSVGDLILCEKASAFGRGHHMANKFVSIFERQIRYALDANEKAILGSQIHQKLLHNFEASRPILDLFAGSGDFERNIAAPAPGADPVFDSFLVNSIVDFNAALCLAMVPGRLSEADYSVPLGPLINDGTHSEIPEGCGLWLKASYLNHACYPNCSRVFIGDVAIVRAAKYLDAGTELSVAYTPPVMLETADKVREKTMAVWEFICTCDLCEARLRLAEQTANKQPTICEEIIEALPHNTFPTHTESGLSLYKDLVAKYPSYAGPNQAPCIEMWALVNLHVRSLVTLKKGPVAVIEAITAGLRCAGFVVSIFRDKFVIEQWGMLHSRLPEILVRLHQAFQRVNPQACPGIKKYVGVAFLAMTGEDETLGNMFPKLVDV